MRVQFWRDYYRFHAPVYLMTMSKAFRLGKYPSVLVLDISSGVQISTHEYAWMSSVILAKERVSSSAEFISFS